MLFTEVLFAEKSELIVSLSFSYPLGALKASIIGILAQTLHWRHVMICSFRRTTLHSAPTHAVHGLHTNVCEHITSHNHSCSSCVSHNPEWLHAKRSSGFTHPWHIHTHTHSLKHLCQLFLGLVPADWYLANSSPFAAVVCDGRAKAKWFIMSHSEGRIEGRRVVI